MGALGHAQAIYDGDGLCTALERCNEDGFFTSLDRACCTEGEACDLIDNAGLICDEFPEANVAEFSCCQSDTTADPGTTSGSGTTADSGTTVDTGSTAASGTTADTGSTAAESTSAAVSDSTTHA